MKEKKIIFIFISLTVVVFLSGCAFLDQSNNYNEVEADWQNEILMATECGLDEMRCCTEKEDLCQMGLSCCFDPSGSDFNFCSPDCACGQEGSFCCAEGEACGPGLACKENICQLCGQEDQPCCNNEEQCAGELVCFNQTCVICGEAGNSCCLPGDTCLGDGAEDKTRSECRQNICTPCGFDGKKACQSEPACNSGQLLNNKACLACGGLNQPCCQAGEEAENNCQPGLTCDLGFCTNL